MGNANLQIIQDGPWLAGVDSLIYPTDLLQGTYAWAVNTVNRGGVVQTRPAKRRIASFCGHRAQGLFWVRTIDDFNYLMVAVDGAVYWAPFPFLIWKQVTGATFKADADRIWFMNGLQAVYFDPSNNLVILPQPKNIVIMQDGVSTPCYWDTSDFSSGQITAANVGGNPAKPMPIGTAMIWHDNRAFVTVGDLVFASDLLFPQSFNEGTYLATQSGFRFPRKVVNLWPSPVQGLLVLTDSSIHALQTYIQDRTQWNITPGFQTDVNLEVGLLAPWAIANLHGMPWLLTARGIISYDRALTQNLTTVILTADGEMARSKYLLSPDVSHACMGYWENVLMVSVPASSTKNRHTWIMDGGIAEKLNNTVGMCWSSIWTGTYPVQITSPIVGGTQRNYELSYSSGFLALDYGQSPSPQPETTLPPQAYIHLFENYMPQVFEQVEEPIWCSWESKAFTLATDDYYRFVFCEIMLVNLYGTVPIQVYVTGLAGNYQPLFTTTLRADRGPFGNPSDETILYYVAAGQTTEFCNYRRQVRHMRTSEYVVNESPDPEACTEISRLGGVDKAFQIMIRWQGRLGIRQVKFFYDRQLQSPQGVCPTDESTTPHIAHELLGMYT